MRIGIVKEIKVLEARVALIPEAAADLVTAGHEVIVQSGAGELSGYSDQQYQALGVAIARDAAELYQRAQLIVKVKEPQPSELAMLRADHLLFSYLHLAAEPELLKGLLSIGVTGVAFETVELENGALPLLAPMSIIAGRLATQIGANLLQRPQGGKGLLLGGLPAAERGHVVVLGGGSAGGNAAAMAAGMGAQVTVFDRSADKLERMRAIGPNVSGLFPFKQALAEKVAQADLLIGAVLVTGEKAPHIIDVAMVKSMQPGSVVVDISVDQGGCIATTRPTTYAAPTYVVHDIVHFAVTNMPGAVPRSASQALSASILPYVHLLTRDKWRENQALARGVNTHAGKIVHPALQDLLK